MNMPTRRTPKGLLRVRRERPRRSRAAEEGDDSRRFIVMPLRLIFG
jgi:hypothetical protein